ncbi:MAG: response regulator [Bacteroidota bacterium]
MKILIVEDHKIVLDGYKLMLNSSEAFQVDEIFAFYTLTDAFRFITETNTSIDLAIFDYNLPASKEIEDLEDGLDLAICFKKLYTTAKIIMLTSHSQALLLYEIHKKLEPNGIWLKSNVNFQIFNQGIPEIMDGETINSEGADKALSLVKKYVVDLDATNRKILQLLHQGIKNKYLPEKLNLSISTINHRKASIKNILGLESADDLQIVDKAKKLGLL